MNDIDRQFLTEWGGETWHAWDWDGFGCVCGKPMSTLDHRTRTFDNWTDFGWLWEKLVANNSYIRFVRWLHDTSGVEDENYAEVWVLWDCQPPKRRCQLILDFLREREGK